MTTINDRRATPIDFTLSDREGQPHEYRCTPHSTTAASPIIVELLGAFSPLLARVAAEAKKRKGMDMELSELMADPDAVEELARNFSAGVVKLPQPVLRALFACTTRDGADMREQARYDAAYAGNMVEWVQACVAIVRANGFLPF